MTVAVGSSWEVTEHASRLSGNRITHPNIKTMLLTPGLKVGSTILARDDQSSHAVPTSGAEPAPEIRVPGLRICRCLPGGRRPDDRVGRPTSLSLGGVRVYFSGFLNRGSLRFGISTSYSSKMARMLGESFGFKAF